jgi:hypothetical protein
MTYSCALLFCRDFSGPARTPEAADNVPARRGSVNVLRDRSCGRDANRQSFPSPREGRIGREIE